MKTRIILIIGILFLSVFVYCAIKPFTLSMKAEQTMREVEELSTIAFSKWSRTKQMNSAFTWEEIRTQLKPGTRLYESGGLDPFGHPYDLGTPDRGIVKVAPETVEAVGDAVPVGFWGHYAEKVKQH